MSNPRGAGRKPKLSEEQFNCLKRRVDSGERISSLADEYGISRQAIYEKLKKENRDCEIRIDYIRNGELLSRLYADPVKQVIRIRNYTDQLSKTPFGWKEHPEWTDFEDLLEKEYLTQKMPGSLPTPYLSLLCEDTSFNKVLLSELSDPNRFHVLPENNELTFSFRRKDVLYTRSDTDGFQMKALSRDRQWFVKSQAVMAGKRMNDWMVEAIASALCEQLEIPHVEQIPCRLFYEGRPYMGVCSRNFELDGYTFISFERLLERDGKSSRDEEFIRLGPLEKLRWCSRELSKAGSLPEEQTLKYMLDLALIDCLVGNTDRHTRNFGLFFSSHQAAYGIPLIFDNGMGLFEHDYYKDEYTDFEEAMRTVYVEPYGEDPFDMLRLLISHFDLYSLYPKLPNIVYPDFPVSSFAKEYQTRILEILVRRQ